MYLYWQIWNDENLKWNRKKNPGVEKLFVSTDNIWMPDVTLNTKYVLDFLVFPDLWP